jgi:hypothetical protein
MSPNGWTRILSGRFNVRGAGFSKIVKKSLIWGPDPESSIQSLEAPTRGLYNVARGYCGDSSGSGYFVRWGKAYGSAMKRKSAECAG